MVTVGQKVVFKTVKGRGRPSVGEVVRRAGIFVEIRDRNGEIVRVRPAMITNENYTFKPYNTKARQNVEA
jgi:hypothetical protein